MCAVLLLSAYYVSFIVLKTLKTMFIYAGFVGKLC
jgi:hypothetical protein